MCFSLTNFEIKVSDNLGRRLTGDRLKADLSESTRIDFFACLRPILSTAGKMAYFASQGVKSKMGIFGNRALVILPAREKNHIENLFH
jgi:hypothetical protein